MLHVICKLHKVPNPCVYSSIACNSTIASNKQIQEHNNLATMQRENLNVAHEHYKSLSL